MADAMMTSALREVSRLLSAGALAGLGDDQLLDRFQHAGDEDAFAALIARHGPMVRGVCLDVLLDPGDVEDAWQTTFLTLVRRGRSIRGGDCVGGWLRRVARRSASALNADRRRHRRRPGDPGTARTEASAASVSARLIQAEQRHAIQVEIDRLPEFSRQAAVLCLVEGYPQREAARQLGVSEGAIRGRLARARVWLRDRLTQRGVVPAAPLVAPEWVVPPSWLRATLAAARLAEPPRAVAVGGISGVGTGAAALALTLISTLALALGRPAPDPAPPPLPPMAIIPLAAPRSTPPPPSPTPGLVAPASPADGRTITLHGSVLDPEGRPIPDARLFLTADVWAEATDQGTTGPEGTYRLDLPASVFRRNFAGSNSSPRVRITLAATHPQFGLAWTQLEHGKSPEPDRMAPEYVHDFHLGADLPVLGRVVDEAGQPIAGASVTVFRIDTPRGGDWEPILAALRALKPYALAESEGSDNPGAWARLPRATTDAAGRFQLTGLGRDRVIHARVSGPGLRDAEVTILTVPGTGPIASAVRARYPRVRRPDGYFYDNYNTPQGVAHAELLYGPEPTIEAERGQTLIGEVRHARTGAPVPGVRITYAGDPSGAGYSATTDAQGRYQAVRQDRDLTVWVHADASSRADLLGATREFASGAGPGEIRADLALEPGIVVTGRVVEAGTDRPIVAHERWICNPPPYPVVAGQVRYFPLTSNLALRATPTGEGFVERVAHQNADQSAWIERDGSFRLLVPPGPGVLLVQARPGLPLFWTESGAWPANGELYPLFPYAPLAQRRPDDGAGGLDPTSFPGFVLPIPVAPYHAYAVIHPAGDATALTVNFAIPRPPPLPVRFVEPSGNPVQGVTIAGLLPPGLPMVTLEGAEVAAIGLDPAQPRSIFALSHDGQWAAHAVLRATDPSVPQTVRLDPIGSASGRLLDAATGGPLAGYTVLLHYDDGLPTPQPLAAPVTGADGRFQIPGLLPDRELSLTFQPPRDPARPFAFPADQSPNWLQHLRFRPSERRDLGAIRVEAPQ